MAYAFSENGLHIRLSAAPLLAQYDPYHADYAELQETIKTYAKCYATIALAVQNTTADKPLLNILAHRSDIAAAFGEGREAECRAHGRGLKRSPSNSLEALYGRYADHRQFTGSSHHNSMIS